MDFSAQRTEHTAAVPLDGGFAVGVVLRDGTGDGREFAIDAVARRAIHTDAVLRNPEDGLVARRARIRGQCETGTAADAAEGLEAIYRKPRLSTPGPDITSIRIGCAD